MWEPAYDTEEGFKVLPGFRLFAEYLGGATYLYLYIASCGPPALLQPSRGRRLFSDRLLHPILRRSAATEKLTAYESRRSAVTVDYALLSANVFMWFVPFWLRFCCFPLRPPPPASNSHSPFIYLFICSFVCFVGFSA